MASAWRCCPAVASAGQGARLRHRAGDGPGLLALPGPGQCPRNHCRAARPRHRIGDGARDGQGLLVVAGPGHRPRDLGQSAPRQTGELMEPAMATACSCWPALAIAPAIATGVRITAGQFL
jgi:hypothetical protein